MKLIVAFRNFANAPKNVSDKSLREYKITHFYVQWLFPENLVVYEMMQKNMVQPDKPQMKYNRGQAPCILQTDTQNM
jgi:hypothetical protein